MMMIYCLFLPGFHVSVPHGCCTQPSRKVSRQYSGLKETTGPEVYWVRNQTDILLRTKREELDFRQTNSSKRSNLHSNRINVIHYTESLPSLTVHARLQFISQTHTHTHTHTHPLKTDDHKLCCQIG